MSLHDTLRDLRELASLLERWVPVTDPLLLAFLKAVRRGQFKTADELAAGVSSFAWGRAQQPHAGHSAVMTDTGVVRHGNEDNWAWRTLSDDGVQLYAVADGMGGHEAGALASALAVRTTSRTMTRALQKKQGLRADELATHLTAAMVDANKAIRALNDDHDHDAGTTLVALVVSGAHAVVGNLGDSRAYLLRNGVLKQITEDHSLVAARVAAGNMTREEARAHPDSNLLLHYLGHEDDVEPDLYELDVQPGDRFLLCTDGLWGELDDRRLTRMLGEDPDPRRTVRRLTRAANDAGGHDNVTAMVVDVPFGQADLE